MIRSELVKSLYTKVPKDSLEEAINSVSHEHDIWGLLYFPQDFSTSLKQRVLLSDITYDNITDESLEVGSIHVQFDSTNIIISEKMEGTLKLEYVSFLKNIFIDCSWPEKSAEPPIKIEKPIYGKKEPLFKESQTASCIMVLVFYASLSSTLAYVLPENKSGANLRSLASGMSSIEIQVPVITLQTLLNIIQILFIFFIEFTIFKNPMEGNLWFAVLFVFFSIINGISYGVLINELSNSELLNLTCATASFGSLAMLNGMLWPMEAMHPAIAAVAKWLPIYHPAQSFHGMIMRGWSILHPKVFRGVIIINTWTVTFLVLAYIVNRVKNK